MAWQTPKTNWQENNALTPTDFNRIEGNIQHLQDTKETPAGAQAKADAAEARAKAYTDQEVGEVAQDLAAHKADDASTTTKGHVQLNNTVTSTSTTQAATASAVKICWHGWGFYIPIRFRCLPLHQVVLLPLNLAESAPSHTISCRITW